MSNEIEMHEKIMRPNDDRAELARLEQHCLNACTYIGPACSTCATESKKAILLARIAIAPPTKEPTLCQDL